MILTDTGVTISRQVIIGVGLDWKTVPALSYKDRRGYKDLYFLPEHIGVMAFFEGHNGWRTPSVSIRGRMRKNDGTPAINRHEETYGWAHRPLPSWVRTRLLQEDIPYEVREAVLNLAYEMTTGH